MFEFEGFDWDAANLKHATRHGLTRPEIEGALLGKWLSVVKDDSSGSNEDRYLVVGRSPTRTLLGIVVTVRGERLRVITAYPLPRRKRKFYEAEI
jgi:uncharacterized DUF497 family protein